MHGVVFESEIASQVFEVVDTTAPILALHSPAPGLACDPIEVRVSATDTVSGVASVRVHIDGDPAGLPLAEVGGDFWAAALSLEEGVHQLEVVAEDVAGNLSDTATVEVDLDLSAPILTVEAPGNGACLVGPATIGFSAEDLHLDVLRARLDGVAITSGAIVSADGDHHFHVSAIDACGRMDTHTSDFTIDGAPPVITVTGVADGGEYASTVEISWTIDDANLADQAAILDGEPVQSGVVLDTPGIHALVIEATDCAGNETRVEIGFTITDDPLADLVVAPPSFTAGGSILLLDRSPAGGSELEAWLSGRAGRVTRVTDACTFVDEIRRSRHELIVLYAPSGAFPLHPPSCEGEPEITDIAAELSAAAYRRGGILVIGEGAAGDGCLGCVIAAAGATFHNHVIDQVEVEGVTAIIATDGDLTLFDLRPLEPDGSFPLLLDDAGGEPVCDGVTTVRLEIDPELAGPWHIDVNSATPHETLDAETGELIAGESLDDSNHPWVDLVVSRSDDTLAIDLRSTSGGALPEWVALTVAIDGAGETFVTSGWIPIGCGLAAGQAFDLMTVTASTAIVHDADQTVAATARRYGRGEALVLPWDALAPANQAALPAVEQALIFSMPTEPWLAAQGLPLPVTFKIDNRGTAAVTIRLEAVVPPTQLLEAWGDPLSLDPVRWEFEIGAGEGAARTIWILPTATVTNIEIPFLVLAGDGSAWTPIDSDTISVAVRQTDHRTELRALRAALIGCAQSSDDPEVQEVLRDMLSTTERVALAGPDRPAAAEAIRDLSEAFSSAEDDRLPCIADLRGRLAELIAIWQAKWTASGGAR